MNHQHLPQNGLRLQTEHLFPLYLHCSCAVHCPSVRHQLSILLRLWNKYFAEVAVSYSAVVAEVVPPNKQLKLVDGGENPHVIEAPLNVSLSDIVLLFDVKVLESIHQIEVSPQREVLPRQLQFSFQLHSRVKNLQSLHFHSNERLLHRRFLRRKILGHDSLRNIELRPRKLPATDVFERLSGSGRRQSLVRRFLGTESVAHWLSALLILTFR